jgi:glycosyltransferase 2 family protein
VKFLLKLFVALAVGAVSIALVMRDIDLRFTWTALEHVSLTAVSLYLVTLAITHVFRVWRWHYLLQPIGVKLRWGHLFTISSVGFMAILALPVRLGEFVRPYFVVRLGQSRMSAVLGTVAVERIVDGLLISMIFFGTYLASPQGTWSRELQIAAWVSLLGFVTATLFLVCALRWTEPTIRLALAMSLLPRFSPRLAAKVRDKLRAVIQGFQVLREPRCLVPFLVQSMLYWGTNGFGMWILAQGMSLDVSPVAAYAAMSFTGVLISLPNSPGLVGQFHLGVVAALHAYLPDNLTLRSTALAYATLLHGIQLIWYALVGFLCLPFVPGGSHSLREAVIQSNRAAEASEPSSTEPEIAR